MNNYTDKFKRRFWNNVDILDKDSCWDWKLSICGSGYGQVRISNPRRKLNTHRVSYELFFGPIPDGIKVLHECNNKRCCNPYHLKLGTQVDNMKDSIEYHKGHYNQYNKRFSENEIFFMCYLRYCGFTYNFIGELFNCTGICISKLVGERRYCYQSEI